MSAFVVCPTFNTPPKHPSDATSVFIPGAIVYGKLHGVTPFHVDNHAPPPQRFRAVCAALKRAPRPLADLGYVGHGLRHGLPSIGVEMDGPGANLAAFAEAILAGGVAPDLAITLAACDAGRDDDLDRLDDIAAGPGGEGGLADRLRDLLVPHAPLVTVIAHAIDGHATKGAFWRKFSGVDDGWGGEWIIEPHSEHWPAFKRRCATSDLFARLARMSRDELLAELAAG